MNHIYRLKTNRHTLQLQPVPETARSAGKGRAATSAQSLAQTVAGAVASVVLTGVASLAHAQQAPPAANQLPQGGVVSRGSANINVNTATAQMTVNQASARAVIDWASFNVGSQAKVQFNQPSSSAVVLNQVQGNNASQIFGQISANGQVILSNPSGIYFSPTSSVDVGSLVATTGKANADDFMAGKTSFNREGSIASVVNEGQLKVALGGYIALLAPEVRNQGVVIAQAGTVALATGEAITLNFNNGGTSLAGLTTTPQAIAALVENRSAVLVEGGQIILSAHALASLQNAVVTNSGQLSATSLTEKGGKIVLMGDKIALSSTSRIDANGPQGGGTVLVGGDWQGSGDTRQATQVSMAQGASIEANATQQGDGGKVVLWSDVKSASSVTQVDGRIDAKGAGTGSGGQVETSGHTLQVGDGASVSTRSSQGLSGQWLIDPNDFTVAATGGDISGATLSTNLGAGNVTITSASGSTSSSTNGSIFINDAVAWSAHTLTLNAQNNVTVNKTMDLTGTAGLAVQYGQNALAAAATGLFTVNAPVNIANTGSFSTKLGSDGSVVNYSIINSLGVAADYTTAPASPSLQGMAKSLTTSFVLGSDIDASSTSSWNSAAGFKPVGDSTTAFSGKFNGLGHSISGLTISASGGNYQGLFGQTTGSISNVTLIAPSVSGNYYVGSLAGSGADFYNIGVVGGTVTGINSVGGMAGVATAAVDTVKASAAVTGRANAAVTYVGGLLGVGQGAINNAFASGDVTVNNTTASALFNGASPITGIGGLVGQLKPAASMTLNNNVSSGNVTVSTVATACTVMAGVSCITNVGGLIGTLGGDSGTAASWRVTLSNSSASGNVSVSSTTAASMSSPSTQIASGTGGLIGRVDSGAGAGWSFAGGLTLTNVSASGNVSGYSAVGGLVGISKLNSNTAGSNVFTNLSASGSVTGFGNTSGISVTGYTIAAPADLTPGVGGLFGSNLGAYVGQIADSRYVGNVTSLGGSMIGGLAGVNTGTVSNSSAIGTITMASSPMNGPRYFGGLIGYLGGGSTLASIIGGSYSNVNITLGSSAATITNAYAIGGLVGGMAAPTGAGRVYISDASAQGNVTVYQTGAGFGIGGLLGNSDLPAVILATVAVQGSTLTASSVSGGTLGVGSVVSGVGILPGTYITALGTGTGGIGTYQLNQAQSTGSAIGATALSAIYIENSVARGNVNAGTGGTVGGLAGRIAVIINSHAQGNVIGASYVGGLAGQAVAVMGSYALGNVTGTANVGGLMGGAVTYSTHDIPLLGIVSSYWAGQSVTATGAAAGGLVGRLSSHLIYDSYTTGTGTVSSTNQLVGGLVGTTLGDIVNSYSTLTVTGTGATAVGGLVGSFGDSFRMPSLSNSWATGAVTGTYQVGGLVGYSWGTISNAYASGATTGTSTMSGGGGVGGLIGFNAGGGSVSNSFANGPVSSTSTSVTPAYVGGLIGFNQSSGSINNSYASGTVTAAGPASAGGLIGYTSIPTIINGTSSNETSIATIAASTTTSITLSNAVMQQGVVAVGALVTGTGVPAGTYIASFGTGQGNGGGSYNLTQAVNVASNTTLTFKNPTSSSSASISGNTLTLGGTVSGYFAPGTTITGSGIPVGTYITAVNSKANALSNGFGGAGSVYTLSNSATLSNALVEGVNVMVASYATVSSAQGLLVPASVGGGLSVGMTVSGPGIPANTVITGYGVQTIGGVLTRGYTLSNSGFATITGPIAVTGMLASPNISNVYATGSVTSNTAYQTTSNYSYLGSLIGQIGSSVTASITNAYASGGIFAPVTAMVGSAVTSGTTITLATPITGGGVTVGAVVTGTGIPANTTIASLGTGTGGAGTYVLSNAVTLTANQVITISAASSGKVLEGGVVGFIGTGNATNSSTGNALSPTLSNLYYNSSANLGMYAVGNDAVINNGLGVGATGLTSSQLLSASDMPGLNFTTTTLGTAASGRAAAGNYWVLVDDNGSYNNASGSGATTPMLASEYALKVTSGHQLQLMGLNPAGAYVMQNSIRFSSSDVWSATGFIPVGTPGSAFSGSFIGSALFSGSQNICPAASGGCTISNLTINSTQTTPVGLFGTVATGASLSGVRLLNATVTGAGSVGAVVGSNAGSLIFSSSTGAVTSTHAGSTAYGVGGVAGENSGSMDRVFSMATVTGTAGAYMLAGGVIGINSGSLSNAYAASLGSISSGGFAGGLVGNNDGGTINTSYAAGLVAGGATVSGGLAGGNPNGTISDSFWDTQTTHQTGPIAVPVGGGPVFGGFGGGWTGTQTHIKGMGTLDMQTLANYNSATASNAGVNPGWNFTTIWNPPVPGALYPALRDFLIPITVTADPVTKVYDGTPYTGTVTVHNSLPNVSLSGAIGYSSDVLNDINVGTYSITPVGYYSNQYNVTFTSGTLTITKRPLTFSDSLTAKVYDGTTVMDASNVKINNLVGTQTLSILSANAASSQVSANSTNYITSIALGNASDGSGGLLANYSVPTSLTRTNAAVTITAKPLTVASLSSADKVYDGTTLATLSGATLTGLLAVDAGKVALSGAFASPNAGNGVSITATLSGLGVSNYALSLASPLTANITPLTLTAPTLSAANKVYDGTTSVTFSGLTGVLAGDVANVSVSGAFASPNVANGISVSTALSGSASGNYSLSLASPLTANITPVLLTASSFSAVNKVYDGTTAASLSGVTLTGVLAADSGHVTLSGIFASKDVANGISVSTTLSGSASGNYSINPTTPVLADITPATLTLSGQKVYDGGKAVAGTSLTATGVNGETFSITGSGASDNLSSANAQTGSVLNSVNGLVLGSSSNGGLAGNYNALTAAASSVNVTRATLTLSGQKVYDGGKAVAGASLMATGVNGETFSVTGSGASDNLSSANVQTGSVLNSVNGLVLGSSSNGGLAGNYNALAAAGSSVSVTPATLTAVSGSKTYDGQTATLVAGANGSLSLTGVNGEAASLVSGQSVALTGANAGTRAVTAAGLSGLSNAQLANGGSLDLSNYDLTQSVTSNSVVISQRPVTVSADAKSRVYGDANPALTYTVAADGVGTSRGLVNSDSLTGSLSTTATGTSNVGSYTIDASALANGNYLITANNGNLAVTQRSVTVSADAKSRVYGDANPALTYTVAADGVGTSRGLVNSDSLSGSLSTTATGTSNVGSYTIDASALANGNYLITANNGNLTVSQRPVTVTNTSRNTTYDGVSSYATWAAGTDFITSNMVGSDRVASLTQTASGAGVTSSGVAQAGSFTVTPSNAVMGTGLASNYSFSYVPSTHTVDLASLTGSTITGTLQGTVSKTYDGSNAATLTAGNYLLTGWLGQDGATITKTSGTYDTANGGSSKLVTVSLTPADYVASSGTNLANYRLPSSISGAVGLINKAALTVQANNDARFVGLPDASGYAGVSYSGWVGGETPSVLGGAVLVSRSASGPDGNTSGVSNLAGRYTGALTASGLSSTNYTISYVPGNYTIVPVDQLLVRVAPASASYGSAASYSITEAKYMNRSNVVVDLTSTVNRTGNSFTVSDGAGGSANFTVTPLGVVTSGSGQLAAGSYQLGATGVNLVSNNFSNNLTVVGAQEVLTVPVVAQPVVSKVYDGTTTIATQKVPLSGVLTGDVVTVSGSGAFASQNAGSNLSYTLSGLALSGADAGNYYLSSSSVSASNGTITNPPQQPVPSAVAQTPTVLTPAVAQAEPPYVLTVVKMPQADDGVLHLELRKVIHDQQVPLPQEVQPWVSAAAAAGDLLLLGPHGEPLPGIALSADAKALDIKAMPDRRMPAQIVLKALRGQLVLRVVQVP